MSQFITAIITILVFLLIVALIDILLSLRKKKLNDYFYTENLPFYLKLKLFKGHRPDYSIHMYINHSMEISRNDLSTGVKNAEKLLQANKLYRTTTHETFQKRIEKRGIILYKRKAKFTFFLKRRFVHSAKTCFKNFYVNKEIIPPEDWHVLIFSVKPTNTATVK